MERDEAQIDELAALVDEAAELRWDHQIQQKILAAGRSLETDYLAAAFTEQGHVRPQLRHSRFAYLPDHGIVEISVGEVPAEVWDCWEDLAERVDHPRARAVLHEVLFWGRQGDVGRHVREVAKAYTELINNVEFANPIDAAAEAFRFIRLGGLEEEREVATDEALKAVRLVLDEDSSSSGSGRPGIVLRVLATLIEYLVKRGEIDDLLEECRSVYPGAHHTTSTIDLQLKRTTDNDVRRHLRREQVEAWIQEASRSEKLTALAHFERAARMASDWGFTDLNGKAVLEMQKLVEGGLPLQRISASVEIPREQVDAFIESMVADSWWQTLLRVTFSGPLSGDVEKNRAQAQEHAQDTPLLHIMPTSHLGPDLLPRVTTSGGDEDFPLTRIERQSILWNAQAITEALSRAKQRFAAPTHSEISEALQETTPIDQDNADAISRVIDRYLREDFEGAAYTAVPIIERLVREYLKRQHEPLYRVQTGDKPGQSPGLGTMLPKLAIHGFDPSWYRYLHTLLTNQIGINFRNSALHGFEINVDPPIATAVLIALLFVAVVLFVNQQEASGGGAMAS